MSKKREKKRELNPFEQFALNREICIGSKDFLISYFFDISSCFFNPETENIQTKIKSSCDDLYYWYHDLLDEGLIPVYKEIYGSLDFLGVTSKLSQRLAAIYIPREEIAKTGWYEQNEEFVEYYKIHIEGNLVEPRSLYMQILKIEKDIEVAKKNKADLMKDKASLDAMSLIEVEKKFVMAANAGEAELRKIEENIRKSNFDEVIETYLLKAIWATRELFREHTEIEKIRAKLDAKNA